MNCLCKWYSSLSRRFKDSLLLSFSLLGVLSAIFTIAGFSLDSLLKLSVAMRLFIVILLIFAVVSCLYCFLGVTFKQFISITINQTIVYIKYGDLFKESGLKVIGCDTHFSTRADDVIIARKSLQGQLVTEHGQEEEISAAVVSEAKRLKLKKNSKGVYDFPLGTVIRYNSKRDGQTYLLLAMAELDSQSTVHTNIRQFVDTLIIMWQAIDRVYACNDIILPVLGSGILRFDDGPKDKRILLKCLVDAFYISRVKLNSKVSIIIHDADMDIPLYEFKSEFKW